MSVSPVWNIIDLPFAWWAEPENWTGIKPSASFDISIKNNSNFNKPVTISISVPDQTGHHVSASFSPGTSGIPPFKTKLTLSLNDLPPIMEEFVIRAQSGAIVHEQKITVIWNVDGIRNIPVHVIMAALDDGSDAPVMAVDDIQYLLSGANRVYNKIHNGMGIRFIFDPEVDLESVSDTKLQRDNPNGTQDQHNPPLPKDFSNIRTDKAHQYKGKVVLFFRNHHGNDPHYADAGNFSSAYGDYVVLHPENGRKYLFAHEVGHYLGLSHPFGGMHDELYNLKTMKERKEFAAIKIKNAIQDNKIPVANVMKELFDADGILDTPPDEPALFGEGIASEDMRKDTSCELDVGVTVSDPSMPLGFKIEIYHLFLTPDKDNVMGYYPIASNPFHISSQQGDLIREVLESGYRKDLFLYN